MSYILFRSQNVTVAAAGTVVTHSLSRATADLHVLITQRSVSSLSIGGVSVITPNTVTLHATGDGTVVDVAILEFHSIQGGP